MMYRNIKEHEQLRLAWAAYQPSLKIPKIKQEEEVKESSDDESDERNEEHSVQPHTDLIQFSDTAFRVPTNLDVSGILSEMSLSVSYNPSTHNESMDNLKKYKEYLKEQIEVKKLIKELNNI